MHLVGQELTLKTAYFFLISWPKATFLLTKRKSLTKSPFYISGKNRQGNERHEISKFPN